MESDIKIIINGDEQQFRVRSDERLIDLLRDSLGLTGSKKRCETGECGACTVIMDGKAVNSCLVLAVDAAGKAITTIEGLADRGELHPLQKSFVKHGALQCGFCTPGMIISAKALIDENPEPSEMEVRRALEGNICRCTGYTKIIDAVLDAAEEIRSSERRE